MNNWSLNSFTDVQLEKEKEEKRELEIQKRKRQREEELKNRPYTPWSLSVGKSDWRYYDEDKNTFASFSVKITNNTKYEVRNVKFQLSIYTGSYKSTYKVFGKTYDKSVNLQPGDVSTINIRDLSDFYLGEDVSNQKNWRIETKVIDVYPKHH